MSTQTPQPKALWTVPTSEGFSYADFARCSREQPTVILGLKQEKGSRSEDSQYLYYVVPSKFSNSWRISRKLKGVIATTQTAPSIVEQKVLPTSAGATKEEHPAHIAHLENISCWTQQTAAIKDQTLAIREQTKLIGDLVGAVWELIQKGSKG